MKIIKLDATPSTNALLKKLWQEKEAEDWTIIWAENQYAGRGQQGTTWNSEPGKNLTFSVLKQFNNLDVRDQFQLNMLVSIGIYEALKELKIPNLSVKWPNDILSGTSKICGILIENMVKANKVKAAVIGIGININQDNFEQLPDATSLKKILGVEIDLKDVLDLVLEKLREQLESLDRTSFDDIRTIYETVLYRKGLRSLFEFADNCKSVGVIRGIGSMGKLAVELENEVREFDLKEIRLLS